MVPELYVEYRWRFVSARHPGTLYGFVVHRKTTSLLSVFPVVYFAFISRFAVRNDRIFLPFIPFLFLSAACLWWSYSVFSEQCEANYYAGCFLWFLPVWYV